METSKLNTLADALTPCIASDGGAACQPLFTATTVGGTVPANTLDAALNIVRHPSTNVSAIFGLLPSSPSFQPFLASVPHDWTLSVTYGNCTSGCGGLNTPSVVAIDATGNVWVANYFGAVVSKFSPLGVPAATQGFPGVGLNESYGIAIDSSGNAWVTNEQSVSAANNSRHGSIASGSNGDMWVADYGSSSATLLASDGSAISGSSGYGPSALSFTSAVAVDAASNAWFAVQGGVVRVSPAGTVSSFSCCDYPAGIAIDQTGNVWLADNAAYAVDKLSSSGAVLNTVSTVSSSASPQGIAIDGAGNVWTANYFGNSITELNGDTAVLLSPLRGYGLDAPLSEPYSIAIDASGNLWLSNSYANTLTEIVGLASPVKTPMLGPPNQP